MEKFRTYTETRNNNLINDKNIISGNVMVKAVISNDVS
jgi:hypothetical protein